MVGINKLFKLELPNNHFSARHLLGFDQFGQVSGTMSVDGKTEIINMRAMKTRRWNMSMNDSVFTGFTDGGICSVQKLEWYYYNLIWPTRAQINNNIVSNKPSFWA